jgi:hypothetical protein
LEDGIKQKQAFRQPCHHSDTRRAEKLEKVTQR